MTTENVAGTGTNTNDAGTTNTAADATVEPTAKVEPAKAEPAKVEPAKVEPSKVPESYDLKMPDGVTLDKVAAEEFTAIAKELGLDQASAQKLADVGANISKRQAQSHVKMVESWAEQTKTDTEIGGDKLDENLAVARKAIDAFGGKDLRELLDSTGVGNHPAIVKFAYKVGKAISEDKMVVGGTATNVNDPAKLMFPTMN